MSFPLTMSGYERTYRPPRSLREHVGGEVTAWDLFRLEHDEQAGAWAASTLASVVASADAESAGALGCTECLDTGFYGAASLDDPDLLLTLVRRVGDSDLQHLTADGAWDPWVQEQSLEVLDVETATDLAEAITAGAGGLLRLYGQPRAFLPPTDSVATQPLKALVSAAQAVTPQPDSAQTHALVHDVDQGAVLELIRISPAGVERYEDGEWVPEDDFDDDLPTVPLDDDEFDDVLRQMTAATLPTVSPDPRAAKLRRYWSHGKGAAKLRWRSPGDWTRCYRHLRKYMGLRAKGYCANLHVMNTGVWPGSRFNVGGNGRGGLFSSATPEGALLAALRSGRVSGDTEGKTTMPDTLTDGVYTETDGQVDALLAAIEASTIPVAAPDAWFDDPKLDRPTTLTVTDEGRVFGHIAPWGVTHIGMAGSVVAPKNPGGKYAYFRTGQHVTASGKSVRVGQVTLNGGHAPMDANVASVVKHYDDTESAVADVAVGEDSHGIWAAGVLRPSVTPEQVRVLRASPPSGDWRRINGQLELVAACCVNVQGFPIAASAFYAGGTVEALVAAGARQMADLSLAQRADEAVVARLDRLDQLVASLAVAETAPAEPVADPDPSVPEDPPPAGEEDNPAAAGTQEPEDEFTDEELAKAAKIAKVREEIAQAKREALRARVNSTTAAGIPEQFKAHVKGKDGTKAKSTIKGTDSFPIGNVADLKKAIQAFGRAGDWPAAKKHIISMAYKLKRPDLIPDNWGGTK